MRCQKCAFKRIPTDTVSWRVDETLVGFWFNLFFFLPPSLSAPFAFQELSVAPLTVLLYYLWCTKRITTRLKSAKLWPQLMVCAFLWNSVEWHWLKRMESTTMDANVTKIK